MAVEMGSMAPQVLDEAGRWLVALREPVVSERDRSEFVRWLRKSPVHVRAYLELAQIWGDAAEIGGCVPIGLAAEAERGSNVVPLPGLSSVPAGRRGNAWGSARRLSMAAGVLLFVTAVAAAGWWYFVRDEVFVTGVGEQRMLTLGDGTIARLNARSRLRVRLSEGARDVDLLEGQAIFEVVADPARPFVVHSEALTVRVLGTTFDVNRRSAGTTVTVVKGKVLVLPAPAPASPASPVKPLAIALEAGERVTVTPRGATRQATDPGAATSWLQRELAFADEPLGAVVDEFNRYSRREIVLAEPRLGELRVNAVFHSTDAKSLLKFVERLDGLAVDASGERIVITAEP